MSANPTSRPPSRPTFPAAARIRSRADFAAAYEAGVRVSDDCLLLIARRTDLPLARLGLSVSKRCGNAVRRNRLKRCLREAFRHLRAELPSGLDLVVQPRGSTPLDQATLSRSLAALVRRVQRKLAASPPSSGSNRAAQQTTSSQPEVP
jgi:ribonuclease P protein component